MTRDPRIVRMERAALVLFRNMWLDFDGFALMMNAKFVTSSPCGERLTVLSWPRFDFKSQVRS